ncbi:two component, sigma54 specific, transcriptional regulator, Fis family [Hydrogenobacter thermophilus TK-6]|nr:two component, sigma54 specific, transcriptional regulator, Fis family [Hydrogenobacter thermophilus TK-6]
MGYIFKIMRAAIPSILIIDDEQAFLNSLKYLFEKKGFKVFTACNSFSALNLLSKEHIDVILMDLKLNNENGLELSKKIMLKNSDIPIIVITAYGSFEDAVNSIKSGIFDFISKPFDINDLILKINKALHYLSCKQKNTNSLDEIYMYKKDIQDKLCIATQYNLPLLLTGETGVGKTFLAKYVHKMSNRKDYNFVHIEASTIPDGLFEAELFGFKKGAFTGAIYEKAGMIELAHNGTLFIDEIECLPGNMQAKLLDVLENRRMRRIGDIQEKIVDFRLITATNIDRDQLKERIRKDLFYRINVIHIHLPPLRELKDMIVPLSYKFMEEAKKEFSKDIPCYISDDVMEVLLNHDYPGNIRELKNIIFYSVAKSERVYLTLMDLPDYIRNNEVKTDNLGFKKLKEFNKYYILKTLERFNYNITKTAKELGISRQTIYRIINGK